jgi:hypothetical protein
MSWSNRRSTRSYDERPVEVPADVDPVVDGPMQGLERAINVGNSAGVVGSDAVLGNDDGHARDDRGGMSDGDADRVGPKLPPLLSRFRAWPGTGWTIRTNPLSGVGLDTDPVVVLRNLEETVLPDPRMVIPRSFEAGHHLKRLGRDRPAHRRRCRVLQHRFRGDMRSGQRGDDLVGRLTQSGGTDNTAA